MTSPFKTYQEFSEAKGPIYTFAHNSAMINFFIVFSVLLLFYFIYISYVMKQNNKSPMALASWILASVLTLGGLAQPAHAPRPEARQTRAEQPARRFQPLALIGMVGIGATTLQSKRRSGKGRQTRLRSIRRSKP
jgi:membrane-bound metal-dependent hydrolase YbcI (DUF457 family)